MQPRDNRPRCCVPEIAWKERIERSRLDTSERRRVNTGSTTGMVLLDGGVFLMGAESGGMFEADGEGPVRRVQVSPFFIGRCVVTNEEFGRFVQRTGYVTEAERTGWSFVFHSFLAPDVLAGSPPVPKTDWWRMAPRAAWNRPSGPGSRPERENPVVHVSWNDSQAYCEWAGYRLPTEAEWEYACRGGLEQKLYPWGDELTPEGLHRCNIWQGEFPKVDTGDDGFAGLAPVDAFPDNGFGLSNMTGNVWEWVNDRFDNEWHRMATRVDPVGPPEGDSRVIRGGSFLCHSSYCNRYRNAARSANTPDSSTGHMGFRVVRDV